MTRLAYAAVLLFATSLGAAACSPEREILSSLNDEQKSKDSGPEKPEKPDSESPPGPLACKAHEGCGPGMLCASSGKDLNIGSCKACAEMDLSAGCNACPPGSIKVPGNVNGCTVCNCGPPSVCIQDAQCADGEHCYLGQTCEPGCTNSPKCCHGNLCANTGCTDTTGLDCNLVGCPNGQVCNASCPPPKCYCDVKLKQWKCEGGCNAICVFPK
ncbi:hypothetical protein LZC95_52870 [Pendulispora brunnea]|uniref:Uncharacterized protein n=1 Tax=Pendulispora brunnea TaxID=2905690 RepID=A0ABZ2KAJ3_9BACT